MSESLTPSRTACLAPSSVANQSQLATTPSCCYFSSRFINLVLFVFNFVFLLSGILILLLTLLYGRPEVSQYLGETTKYLNNIITLLGSGHLVQIIHYSMLFTGVAICTVSLINITISLVISWSKSGDHYYYHRRSKFTDTDESLLYENSLDSPKRRYDPDQQRRRRSSIDQRSISHCAHSSCTLCCYIFVMLFLFTIQLVVGLLSVVTVTPEHVILHSGRRHLDNNDDFLISIRESVDISNLLIDRANEIEPLYASFHCCGWLYYDDYEYLHGKERNKSLPVPDACCKSRIANCGQRKHPNNIYYDGCWKKFGAELRDYVLMLGWTALAFAVLELIGVIFAICHYIQLVPRTRV